MCVDSQQKLAGAVPLQKEYSDSDVTPATPGKILFACVSIPRKSRLALCRLIKSTQTAMSRQPHPEKARSARNLTNIVTGPALKITSETEHCPKQHNGTWCCFFTASIDSSLSLVPRSYSYHVQ